MLDLTLTDPETWSILSHRPVSFSSLYLRRREVQSHLEHNTYQCGYDYLMFCPRVVSGSWAMRSATDFPTLAFSAMLTRSSAGLKKGGSFSSRTSTTTVAVEVVTGLVKGTSLVTTTSSVKTGPPSKSSSWEAGEKQV